MQPSWECYQEGPVKHRQICIFNVARFQDQAKVTNITLFDHCLNVITITCHMHVITYTPFYIFYTFLPTCGVIAVLCAFKRAWREALPTIPAMLTIKWLNYPHTSQSNQRPSCRTAAHFGNQVICYSAPAVRRFRVGIGVYMVRMLFQHVTFTTFRHKKSSSFGYQWVQYDNVGSA